MHENFPWTDSFAIGHIGLDAEHRHLVKLINEIAAVVVAKRDPKELADRIDALRRVAGDHMRHENVILWEIRSGTYNPWKNRIQTAPFLKAMAEAAFGEHMREHEDLEAGFNVIVAGPAERLGEDLKRWFLDHVVGYESHLRSLFQAAP
jgi:hemerythrin